LGQQIHSVLIAKRVVLSESIHMDKHKARRDQLRQSVLQHPAATSPELRQQCATSPTPAPSDVAKFVDQVHNAAYRVTTEQVDAMRKTRTEAEIFEITIAAALGKADSQMSHALKMLQDSKEMS
jgi:alkylhydroperoxidase family enzyme